MSEQPTHKVVHTYGKVDKAYGLRMFTMAPEEDGPVFMVNFMKYKEVADYGAQSGGVPWPGCRTDRVTDTTLGSHWCCLLPNEKVVSRDAEPT